MTFSLKQTVSHFMTTLQCLKGTVKNASFILA
jgi:hypothetical protein